MCGASKEVKDAIEAAKGGTYDVAMIRTVHGFDIPGFRTTDGTRQCACVQHGTTITLIGIPATLQKKLGIGQIEVVKFIERSHEIDRVEFKNGQQRSLGRFAHHRITVFVGVKEAAKPARLKVTEEPTMRVHAGVLAAQGV